jgi:hypothetical protein
MRPNAQERLIEWSEKIKEQKLSKKRGPVWCREWDFLPYLSVLARKTQKKQSNDFVQNIICGNPRGNPT